MASVNTKSIMVLNGAASHRSRDTTRPLSAGVGAAWLVSRCMGRTESTICVSENPPTGKTLVRSLNQNMDLSKSCNSSLAL